MAKDRVRLKLDYDSLFPGEVITIGQNEVMIRPLGVSALITVVKHLNVLVVDLKEQGLTWQNFETPENLLKIAGIVVTKFPDLLAEATNIAEEDIAELPLPIVVSLMVKVVEVNLKAKEDLEKNFQTLAEKFKMVAQAQK